MTCFWPAFSHSTCALTEWIPHIFFRHPLSLPLSHGPWTSTLLLVFPLHRCFLLRGEKSLSITLLSQVTNLSSFYSQGSWKSNLHCLTSWSLLKQLQFGFCLHCTVKGALAEITSTLIMSQPFPSCCCLGSGCSSHLGYCNSLTSSPAPKLVAFQFIFIIN